MKFLMDKIRHEVCLWITATLVNYNSSVTMFTQYITAKIQKARLSTEAENPWQSEPV